MMESYKVTSPVTLTVQEGSVVILDERQAELARAYVTPLKTKQEEKDGQNDTP